MSKFTLYTTPTFSRGTLAQILLEECGANYQLVHIALDALPNHPTYHQINPNKKVPALLHDGHVITELPAIALYLSDIYHQHGIAPAPNTPERGQMYRILFMLTNFEYAIFDKIRHQPTNEQSRQQNGYGDFDTASKPA